MDSRVRISRLLVFSFTAVILLGALGLLLPFSTTSAENIPSITDALFMSTSAVCVTGLATFDISQNLTFQGQFLMLVLIQLGGLGILTFSNVAITLASRRRKLNLSQRMLVEETHGGLPYIEPKQLLKRIVTYTATIEIIGAVVLTLRFWGEYSFTHAVWLGLFHSVSAFCNAGFSLFSNSFENFSGDFIVNMTLAALIILGGLGFVVFADVAHQARRSPDSKRPRRLSLHTRVVLKTSLVLVVGAWLIFFILEALNPTNQGGIFQRSLQAFFLSVTTRTAGFNTTPMDQLSNPTILIISILMIIGASPGSTGGGIKTTTLAILNAILFSRARNRPRVEIEERSIPPDLVAKAVATTAAYFLLVVSAIILLQMIEFAGQPHQTIGAKFLDYAFEVISALGTVGLSLGITAKLTAAGKIVIIACMFLGRVGPLLLATSLIGTQRQMPYKFPEERLLVG